MFGDIVLYVYVLVFFRLVCVCIIMFWIVFEMSKVLNFFLRVVLDFGFILRDYELFFF